MLRYDIFIDDNYINLTFVTIKLRVISQEKRTSVKNSFYILDELNNRLATRSASYYPRNQIKILMILIMITLQLLRYWIAIYPNC
jgi:hypothetical protein